MTVRNVKKSLAGMQDIAQGATDITQTRGGVNTTMRQVDVPYAVATNLEMQNLDILLFTRARVYSGTTDFVDYVYDASGTVGIMSNTGAGVWVAAMSTYNVMNAQVGTAYTLLLSDKGKHLTFNNAGAITVTVPASLGVHFDCDITQLGAGQVTLSASSTTLNSAGNLLSTSAQFSSIRVRAYLADTLLITGDRA